MAAAFAVCGVNPPIPAEGLAWPANGHISNAWSLDCVRDSGHRGIDIDVQAGTNITASAAGVVIFAGYTPSESGGTTVSIELPGGLRTTYLHLTGLEVSEGENVSKGQVLGRSDGRPLHFGLKSTGNRENYFNPEDFLPAPALGASGSGQTEQSESAAEASALPVAAPANDTAAETVPPLAEGERGPVSDPRALTASRPAASPASEPSANAVGSEAAGASGGIANASGNQPQRMVPALPLFPHASSGTAPHPGLGSWLGKGMVSTTAPFRHGDVAQDGVSGHRFKGAASAAQAPFYAIALACGVLLIVFAGRGMGGMAGNPASC